MSHLPELQQANIAIVQDLYAAFADQDIESLLRLLAEDVDWLFFGPTEIPFSGHFIGTSRVRTFFERALETTEFLVFEPREYVAGTGTVLVQGYERAIAKSTGREWKTDWAHVFTLEGERITKLREYYDTAVMVEAFKLA